MSGAQYPAANGTMQGAPPKARAFEQTESSDGTQQIIAYRNFTTVKRPGRGYAANLTEK
tara:strand:+ start:7024 stop:7200 length:177 start_codon:yes stop_codon:yes gene_type:complete